MPSQTTKIGRYEVLSVLGQGAMGTVYKAADPVIERPVAIKTINLNLSKEERAEFEERFYREAKSAGCLSHANIVTIYDVGETGDMAYIAMEYVEGKSLREMLDSGVVLPVEMIARIVARVASALNYAHENHVVHRDIKPANIMITSGRDVKIMDFGIAQIPTGSRTQLGTVLGSPKYMAPEQVAGQPTDGRTDIFALGVVLYEMLTGTTPFNGDNLSAIMYKILHEEPAPPSTINHRVPPVFDRIVSRALAKRPEDRYQTGREFAQDLRNPDAASSRKTRRSAGSTKPEKTVPAGRTLGDEPDTTLFMQPRNARGSGARRADPGDGPGGREKMAVLLGRVARKPLWFALPVLVIAGWMVVSHEPHTQEDTVAASTTQQPEVTPQPTATQQPEATPQPAATPHKAPKPARSPAQAVAVVSSAPAVSSTHKKVPAQEDVTPSAPVEQATASLLLAISPWGEVYVDGKRAGVSPPLATLQLEAGRHKIEIRNQAFPPYRDNVNLEPGTSLKIRHKFE